MRPPSPPRTRATISAARTLPSAASVYTVETCAEVIADLFRYGGGRVLSLASPLQRYLRDALAACLDIPASPRKTTSASAASASHPPTVDR